MSQALLLVDVLKDFRHEDGDALLASYRRRQPALVTLLADARARGIPVVYANDRGAHTRPDDVVREAVEDGKAGELVAQVAPERGEPVVLKDGYSAFEGTSLQRVLGDRDIGALLVAGAATEMCVFQTAVDAHRAGFDVCVRGDASATVDAGEERLALDRLERELGLDVVRPAE